MNFLILVDNSFSNKYSKEFESQFLNKINSLKNNLNCDIKFIENKNIENIENYLNNIYEESEGYDNIIYIPCNMPLFRAEETIKLTKIHEENIAYFSYGENYPIGIIPFIIRRDAFEKLFDISKNKNIKISENAIKDIVFIDPNFFEIEILVSEFDMRYYRLYLFADCKRNSILISRLIDYKSYEEIVKAIKENPIIRRTLPAYIEIDINNRQNILNKNLFLCESLKKELSKEEKNKINNDFLLGYTIHILTDIVYDEYFEEKIRKEILKNNQEKDYWYIKWSDMDKYSFKEQSTINTILLKNNNYIEIKNITKENGG